jgi:NAD(P)-dependent dehydrogenase (short-subunit alcohol dehydrogenase family)
MNDTIADVDLSGQVAIVTGGGKGLGKVYAQFLARAGASVAVMARTEGEVEETAAGINAEGGRAIAVPGDVTDPDAVERVVAQTEKQLGPVDLLVNNAGDLGPVDPRWEADADEWWRCVVVNVRGPLLCARAVLPGMIARHYGRIINAASIHGVIACPYGAYGISKTALVRFTENLAIEAREHGVSVFAIHPGGVYTSMWETLTSLPGEQKWLGGAYSRAMREQPGTPPEKAATLVVSLASGMADALSGCFISVGYDLPDMVARAEEIQEDDLYKLRIRTLEPRS